MEVLNSFMTWIFKNRLGQIENFKENPLEVQHEIFLDLIEAGKRTKFGKEFNFLSIRTYQDFAKNVPHLSEVSIGHALISDALYLGLEETVKQYLDCLK